MTWTARNVKMFRYRLIGTTLALSMTLGCGGALTPKAPPNLTPQVTAKFYATYIIKDLDIIRDFADDANKTVPPVVSNATLKVVVTWHEALVTVIHASPDGWRTAVDAGLTQLEGLLPPADAAKFKAYIDATRVLVRELQ